VKSSGPMEKTNPIRFSTKYQDDETDLVYYGYRYYNPSAGGWEGKDPIGERGGLNPYGFVRNNPEKSFDPLGLDVNVISAPFRIDAATCCSESDKVTIGLIVRGKFFRKS
jgi:RHS repeat-associated protein